MSFLKKLEEFVGAKKANVDELRKASLAAPEEYKARNNLSEPLTKDDIEITSEYREVIKAIESHDPFIFVSGKAGTGKTTLIGYLRDSVPGNVVVVAPTGVTTLESVVNNGCIHSAAQIFKISLECSFG